MAKNIIKLTRGDSYEFRVSIPEKENSAKSLFFIYNYL